MELNLKFPKISIEIRIGFIYLVFGVSWIVFSDRFLESFTNDITVLTNLQTYKGWFFVFASAMLIFFLLRRDLKKQHRIEAEMHEKEERYRLLFDTSLDAILLAAPDGQIFGANPSACRIFGRTETEICELGRSGVIDIEDVRLPVALEERGGNGHYIGELTFIRKGGEKFPGEISITLFKDKLGRERSSMIIRDISERKRAEAIIRANEEKLRQLNNELEQRVVERTNALEAAMLKARVADRLKSAFLATMSHELRTPLNSIIGFTGVLSQGMAGPLNAEQVKQLGMVRTSAHHLLDLVNDVLDLSKIEAGQLEVKKSAFDMHSVLEEVLRIVSASAQKKGLSLQVCIDPEVGTIISDRQRVQQILLNLVNNAIKFSDHGEITVECRWIDGFLQTSVSDNGIGIHPEEFNKLFKPFQQLETGINRKHEGTGLGLSICKNLVHLLGGEINVESELGKGSIFTFLLPSA
ncbi:MAG: hypothetical protein CVU39_28545 [Chloroflexi bacterium HGW-Chloroflexi-10]|nr:MAG: hypothetical protein CVU39_28545 [Chloroflexi bacterium HGW-Chloroflexi-10]